MRDYIITRIHGSLKLMTSVLALVVLLIGTTVWCAGSTSPSTFNRVVGQSSISEENNSTLNSRSSGVHFTAESKFRINSTTTNSNSGHVPHPVQKVDILVIVMGEAKSHSIWKKRIANIKGSVSLLYGSYDEEIPINRCENEHSIFCEETVFIPGTTWTQGRNLLAAQAMRKERKREKKYDYWMFLDDDVSPRCDGGEHMERLLGEGNCWQKVFNFISSDQIPEKVSTIALPMRETAPPGFVGVSNAHAMFAAFKREQVPYLLPYATIPEGGSEWTSQAALFCVMQKCMKNSVLYIPYVGGVNAAHREYVRGLNITEIRQTIVNNYHDDAVGFTPCKWMRLDQLGHGTWDKSNTFNTGAHLNNIIPEPKLEKCEPMRTRFEKWESQITA